MPATPFLQENDPFKNLEILADFQPSDVSSKRCMTREVYRQVPKRNISASLRREIAILSTIAAATSLPFCFLAKKTYQSIKLFISEAYVFALNGSIADFSAGKKALQELSELRNNLEQTISDPVKIMGWLCFASLSGLAGTAAYFGAAWYLQDKTQGERWEKLNRIYSEIAGSLLKEFALAKDEKKTEIIKKAIRLTNNAGLIKMSLRERACLTAPQVDLLTEKIAHAARSVLRMSSTKTSPKNVAEAACDS